MNYLTEIRLKEILETSKYDFVHNKGLARGIRYRPDFKSDELMLVVEFDGYQHYNNTKAQKNDRIKESLYRDMGYTLIRIPYFIQLTHEVYKQLFVDNGFDLGIDLEHLITYPHGFRDEKALKPCDFNIVGVDKFLKQMAVEFRPQQYEVFETIRSELDLIESMEPMDDLVKYVRGFVKSGFDTNGMLKHISETATIKKMS